MCDPVKARTELWELGVDHVPLVPDGQCDRTPSWRRYRHRSAPAGLAGEGRGCHARRLPGPPARV